MSNKNESGLQQLLAALENPISRVNALKVAFNWLETEPLSEEQRRRLEVAIDTEPEDSL